MSVPIWLTLIRIELASPLLMPSESRCDVGDEQIVADELALVPDPIGQHLPALEVVLRHAVLDRDDRIARNELGEVLDLLALRARFPLAFIDVGAVLEELGGGAIERQQHVLAGAVAGFLDRLA